MNLFLNILLIIFVSTIVCFLYDLLKSYILTKKIKQISKNSSDSWSDFWDNIPISNDFDDKEDE